MILVCVVYSIVETSSQLSPARPYRPFEHQHFHPNRPRIDYCEGSVFWPCMCRMPSKFHLDVVAIKIPKEGRVRGPEIENAMLLCWSGCDIETR